MQADVAVLVEAHTQHKLCKVTKPFSQSSCSLEVQCRMCYPNCIIIVDINAWTNPQKIHTVLLPAFSASTTVILIFVSNRELIPVLSSRPMLSLLCRLVWQ